MSSMRWRDELAGGDLVLQLAGAVVEVIMAPAVALGPPDHLLAAVDEAQGLDVDVGVEDFLDEDLDLARGRVGQADVVAVQVAALAAEVELVGRVGQPLGRRRVVPIPVAVRARRGEDVEIVWSLNASALILTLALVARSKTRSSGWGWFSSPGMA